MNKELDLFDIIVEWLETTKYKFFPDYYTPTRIKYNLLIKLKVLGNINKIYIFDTYASRDDEIISASDPEFFERFNEWLDEDYYRTYYE